MGADVSPDTHVFKFVSTADTFELDCRLPLQDVGAVAVALNNTTLGTHTEGIPLVLRVVEKA